jgi:hypothetical protein
MWCTLQHNAESLQWSFHIFIRQVFAWRVSSSGMWCRVVCCDATDVSVERIAVIISSTLKMEAICSSETSVASQQTTRRHIPEDDTLHNHRCENLKSYKYLLLLGKLMKESIMLQTWTTLIKTALNSFWILWQGRISYSIEVKNYGSCLCKNNNFMQHFFSDDK